MNFTEMKLKLFISIVELAGKIWVLLLLKRDIMRFTLTTNK